MVPGSAGAGLVGGLALRVPAFDQRLDPVASDLVVARDVALGASLNDDGGDDQTGLGHRGHLQERCQLCPGTGANYVVERDTAPATPATNFSSESTDPSLK